MTAQLFARKNRYIIKGSFHAVTASEPVHDEDDKGKLLGITNPRSMTYIHSYGGEAVFFESLAAGKLIASQCRNQQCRLFETLFMPFRIHCPDCLGKNLPSDITEPARKTARIHTFMVCERAGAFNTLQLPIRFINIEFTGVATILMSYLCAGMPEIGRRVLPIFQKEAPTYTILDLSWVLESEKHQPLPPGFSF